MLYDDIFNAAINEDIPQLKALLSTPDGKKALHELIPSQDNDEWKITTFTVMFAILNQTQNNINYEVLDILMANGASFNDPITLKNRTRSWHRNLLEFAIDVWADPTLTEYMLKNGADPNAYVSNCYGDKVSNTQLLYYAIMQKGTQMLELLLKYGADPNKCSKIYAEDQATYQFLPPLYYSLVHVGDHAMTVCLLRYGANPQCAIDVGKGYKHNTIFTKYLEMCYPNLVSALISAFDEAKLNPAVPVKAPATSTTTNPSQPVDSNLNSGSKVISFRRCYGKIASFFFGNFGILALALSVIAPIIYLSEDAEVAGMFFLLGLPFVLICTLIALNVYRKAKKSGQDGIMGKFFLSGFLAFVITFAVMTIVLIPLLKFITTESPWKEIRLKDGRTITARDRGDGTYEDAAGNIYSDSY